MVSVIDPSVITRRFEPDCVKPMTIKLKLPASQLSTHIQEARGDRRGRDCMVVGFATTCVITKIASSNLAHADVYSLQHYVIKLVCHLRHCGGFH